jgi:aspartokinase/homoserine dehydrogenase 1
VRKFCIRQLYSRLKKKYSNSYKKYIQPEAEGTLISNQQMDTNPVKGISHIDKISLITLEGPGMIGVAGSSKDF